MATLTASAAQAASPALFIENGAITRFVSFTQSASYSAGDVIQMVRIPQGAVVMAVNTAWSFSAGVATVNIGDGNDASAYGASVVMSAVSAVAISTFRGPGRSYSAEDTIDITIATISTPPANAQITMVVTYTMQNGSGL